MYTLCKNYLEENNNFWKKLKEKQNEENKRIERIEKARIKAREARNKYENKEWEQRLQEGLEKVPRQERDRVEEMNARQENLELKTAKEKLWKLRNKENKLVETAEVKQIRELDKKTEQVIELLEKEKTRLLARDKNLRTAIKNPENKIKKQKLIAEVWTTYRWITEYLEQTTSDWDKKKKQRVLEETTRLNNWDNKTRNEKIKSWIEDEKQRREQETTNKQEFITTIIQEILFKVETSVAKLQIMNVTTANNDKSRNLLQPPKLLQQTNNEQVQTVTKEKKQLNIKNFFQQKEITDRTSSTQITTCSTLPAEGGVTVPSLPTVEASTDKWAGGERGSQKERDPGGGYVPTSFPLTHTVLPETSTVYTEVEEITPSRHTDEWAGGERGSQRERDSGGGYVPTSFLLTHTIPPETSTVSTEVDEITPSQHIDEVSRSLTSTKIITPSTNLAVTIPSNAAIRSTVHKPDHKQEHVTKKTTKTRKQEKDKKEKEKQKNKGYWTQLAAKKKKQDEEKEKEQKKNLETRKITEYDQKRQSEVKFKITHISENTEYADRPPDFVFDASPDRENSQHDVTREKKVLEVSFTNLACTPDSRD